jgi:hypothetical protein
MQVWLLPELLLSLLSVQFWKTGIAFPKLSDNIPMTD